MIPEEKEHCTQTIYNQLSKLPIITDMEMPEDQHDFDFHFTIGSTMCQFSVKRDSEIFTLRGQKEYPGQTQSELQQIIGESTAPDGMRVLCGDQRITFIIIKNISSFDDEDGKKAIAEATLAFLKFAEQYVEKQYCVRVKSANAKPSAAKQSVPTATVTSPESIIQNEKEENTQEKTPTAENIPAGRDFNNQEQHMDKERVVVAPDPVKEDSDHNTTNGNFNSIQMQTHERREPAPVSYSDIPSAPNAAITLEQEPVIPEKRVEGSAEPAQKSIQTEISHPVGDTAAGNPSMDDLMQMASQWMDQIRNAYLNERNKLEAEKEKIEKELEALNKKYQKFFAKYSQGYFAVNANRL